MESAWEIAEREFFCGHQRETLCVRTLANQTKQLGYQCFACGKWRAVKRDSVDFREQALAGEFRESLRDEWNKRRSERHAEIVAQQRESQSLEWWASYQEYLKSDTWKSKRERVLERDAHTCQACCSRKATQVHHLTYQHVFKEPLFELVSVCEVCHKAITAMDRERRENLQGIRT